LAADSKGLQAVSSRQPAKRISSVWGEKLMTRYSNVVVAGAMSLAIAYGGACKAETISAPAQVLIVQNDDAAGAVTKAPGQQQGLLHYAAAAASRAPIIGSDPNFFPIGVWLQTPQNNATKYKNIGVNIFTGLYDGPTNTAMSALETAGLYTIVGQQAEALASSRASVVQAWLQDDEPDNAQPNGSGGYGPCIDPPAIVAKYKAFKAADPSRPVLINFGRGAADVNWVGRGVCSGKTGMYKEYAKGADILSFDIYPVNNGDAITYVAKGVDNLRRWGGGKPVWAFVETTAYESDNVKPTPAQVKAEVWLALTHGALGIQYFVHIFEPGFIEAGLLADSEMSSAVGAINSRIKSLAPVLNSATIENGATVVAPVRIDFIVKKYSGFTYLFAVNPTRRKIRATFSVAGIQNGAVKEIEDGRNLSMNGDSFSDSFEGYGVHLYRIQQP
jgi:hypothetical protein